jgi:hypothetical protein
LTSDCGTCSRPIADGATICVTCAYRLDDAIQDVSAYRGLAYDLDIAVTRQAKLGAGGIPQYGGGGGETPVAFNGRASKAADALKNVLSTWARVIAGETGAELPVDDLARIATWLRPRVGWLRHHEAGAEAWNAILDAVRDARRAVDRRPEKLYAGPCDCGEDLYAHLDAAYVICHSIEHDEPLAWPVDERRRWLLASAEDVLATTTEISRALTRYQQPVTPSAIRGYVARKRLTQRGERVENGKTLALYRLGDVLEIVTPAPEIERVSA